MFTQTCSKHWEKSWPRCPFTSSNSWLHLRAALLLASKATRHARARTEFKLRFQVLPVDLAPIYCLCLWVFLPSPSAMSCSFSLSSVIFPVAFRFGVTVLLSTSSRETCVSLKRSRQASTSFSSWRDWNRQNGHLTHSLSENQLFPNRGSETKWKLLT